MKERFLQIILTVILLTAVEIDSLALDRVVVNGKNYYRYEVKKGDTMFGIAKDNGWDFNILQETNSGAMSPLSKGYILFYPCDPVVESDQSNSKITIADEKDKNFGSPLSHKVIPGETIYGISRIYGITPDTLYALNPGSRDGIKAGQTLILPSASNVSGNAPQTMKYHNVERGETLYGLSKTYNVSIEAILLENPGLANTTLRAGDVIKIPAEGTGIISTEEEVEVPVISGFRSYKAKKDDTWESIAGTFNIEPGLLMATNKGIQLKKNSYIGIPLLSSETIIRECVEEDIRESTEEGLSEIYDETHGVIADTLAFSIRIALVLDEPSSRKDTEFLRGFLTGVDKLKNKDSKIHLKVIDGARPSAEVINGLNEFQPTLIISSAEKMLPDYLARYAADNRTMLVNTFDVRNEQYLSNPYIIQLITPSDYFNEEVAFKIQQQYDNYTLVFVGDKDENDSLADALRKIWAPSRVRERSVVDLTTLPLAENARYLMYGYPVKKNEIAEFLSAVESATTRQPLAMVTVIGRPNWIMYADALGDQYNNAGVLIPSRFYMDKDDLPVEEFNAYYNDIFDRQLMKSFPSYGAVGYDTAKYFLTGLSQTRGDFNSLPEGKNLLQSYYTLKRPSNWSGLVNSGVFILRHRPFGDVEKIIVK